MISFIKGELYEITEDVIVLMAGAIGYEIRVPLSVISGLPPIGKTIKIHTYLYVREDAMLLYGFLTKDDLKVFKQLITVSGIGPRGALGILSTITPDELRFAVLAEDVKTISKAPGIGKKTAQKLILELKDKLDLQEALQPKGHLASTESLQVPMDVKSEAIQALTALGYSSTEALQALREITITDETTVEILIKEALKKLALF